MKNVSFNSRVKGLVVLVIMFFILALLVLNACDQQKEKREQVQKPASKYHTEEETLWQKAKAENTVEAYEGYLQKYPKGKHAREAKEGIIKRSVEIKVEQSYDGARGVNLPIEEWIVSALRAVVFYNKTYKILKDGIMEVKLRGTSKAALYIDNEVHYLGPVVQGKITLSTEEKCILAFFYESTSPPTTLTFGSPTFRPPKDATFESIAKKGICIGIMELIAQAAGLEPIIFALQDEDWHVRQAAVETLKDRAPRWYEMEEAKRAVPEFISALKDEDSRVREAAAEALGELKDPRAVEPLVPVLKDKSENVRIAAKKALEKINPKWYETEEAKRAVPEFISTLKDEDSRVRQAAAEALGDLKDPHAVEPLVPALKDKSENVRIAAKKALEKINPRWYETEEAKKTVPEFISALKDEDSRVREAAAEALGELKDPRAVEPLISALEDMEWMVCFAAADALRNITGKDFGEDQSKWQKWWEENKDKYQNGK